MRNIFLIVLLGILFTSCGKGTSDARTQAIAPVTDSVSACNTFSSSDSLEELASKANNGRSQCHLSEEEVVAMIKGLLP